MPSSFRRRSFDRRQGCLLLSQFVKLVKLGLEQSLIRQSRLILGDECRRHRPAQCVLDHFVVLRGTQKYTNRRLLVRFLHVAVEGLQVKLQLAEKLRLEFFNLEVERDQAVECPIEKQQVDFKVPSTDLNSVVAADETEVAAKFDQELLQLFEQGALQVGLGVPRGQVEEFKKVAVFENRWSIGMQAVTTGDSFAGERTVRSNRAPLS